VITKTTASEPGSLVEDHYAPGAPVLRGLWSIGIGFDQQSWHPLCAGANGASTLMNIPEILDCLEEPDLEDWLTAAFIENESRLPLDRLCTGGAYPFPSRTPDIWMLEIIHRTGKSWKGRFNVEFSTANRNGPEKETTVESQTGRLFFTLDTETAEVTFEVDAGTIPETSG
jgi:hypothetical protein